MSELLIDAYPIVRGVIYVALLLAFGSAVARHLLSRAINDDGSDASAIGGRLRSLTRLVAASLPLLILVRGFLQLRSLVDPGDAITSEMVREVLGSGPWGHAWLLQLAAALVFAALCWMRPRTAHPLTLGGLLVVMVLAWAQSGMGHAATDRWPAPIGRILDTLHLTGAGVWIGTLAVLAIAAIPSLRAGEQLPVLARVVRGFSLWARAGVTLVLVSGVIAALVYAGSVQLLIASTWGRLLIVKVIAMSGVMVLGWYNWRVVTPALNRVDPGSRARLIVAVRVELALAVVMLALTAFLVASPLPGES